MQDEYLLKENIEGLILDVTTVETSLIAEGYKYRKLYPMDKKIIELSDSVAQYWSMLKKILVKTQFNGNYRNESLKNAVLGLAEAVEGEIQLIEYFLEDKINLNFSF